MAERLTSRMKVREAQYTVGSPLLLEACALYLDNVSGQCIAQLKWKNLDPRPVTAVLIELNCYDAFDQKQEPVSFQYDGLMVTQGSEFGSRVPVQIRNAKVVRYDTVLKAVSFAEGKVWRAENTTAYTKLPETLPQMLEGNMFDQYKRDLAEMGIKGIVAAAVIEHSIQTAMGLWQCGCGSWQLEGTPCLQCHIARDSLQKASDIRNLTRNLQAYNEEVERLRIEAERKAAEERALREKTEIWRREKEKEKRLADEQQAREEEIQRREAKAADRAGKICIALAVGAVLCWLAYFFLIK